MPNVLNYSMIQQFKKCRKAYEYRHLDLIVPKVTPEALQFGSMVHDMLKAFYQFGCSHADLKKQTCTIVDISNKELWGLVVKAGYTYLTENIDSVVYSNGAFRVVLTNEDKEKFNLAVQMVRRYFEKFIHDRENYTVLFLEIQIKVPIRTTNGKISKFKFGFTPDVVVMDELFNIYLVEHKTTKESVTTRLDSVDTDSQVYDYAWAVGMFLKKLLKTSKDITIKGVIYNVLRKKNPRVPEVLKSGKGLSKNKAIDTTYEVYRNAIDRHGFDPEDYYEVLEVLDMKGDTFTGREIVPISKSLVSQVEAELYEIAKEMNKKTISLYRCMDRLSCNNFCKYSELCKAELKGNVDADFIRENDFEPTEIRYK